MNEILNSAATFARFSYQNYQRNLRERQAAETQQQQNAAAVVARDSDAEVIDEVNSADNPDTNLENENRSESAPDANNAENGSSSLATTPELDENNRLPTVALLRTFVLSFFASLIPETPAV